MNETHRRAFASMALAIMASSGEYHGAQPKGCRLLGEDASQRAIGLNDHKKLSTRKQRMKAAMRKAFQGKA